MLLESVVFHYALRSLPFGKLQMFLAEPAVCRATDVPSVLSQQKQPSALGQKPDSSLHENYAVPLLKF